MPRMPVAKIMQNLETVRELVDKVKCRLFGIDFNIRVMQDQRGGHRVYLQVYFTAPCSVTGQLEEQNCRKFYLSEYATDDEIIKTCYVAFEMAVKHEILESFRVDDIAIFNPHITYKALQAIAGQKEYRT